MPLYKYTQRGKQIDKKKQPKRRPSQSPTHSHEPHHAPKANRQLTSPTQKPNYLSTGDGGNNPSLLILFPHSVVSSSSFLTTSLNSSGLSIYK